MIKVVVVDDSASVRQMVKELFGYLKDMELSAIFGNPLDVIEFLRTYRPDVLVLDIEMPEMDGITLLEKVLAEYDIPTIMFSSYSQRGSINAMRALELGAVEVVAKDHGSLKASGGMWDELVRAIRCAAAVNMHVMKRVRREPEADKTTLSSVAEEVNPAGVKGTRRARRVVAIGASTGGTQALERVLSQLGPMGVPILVVQHMPVHFTSAFAKRLDSVCAHTVKEATDGYKLVPNEILIAPGGRHLRVVRQGFAVMTQLRDDLPVAHHCPSVDVLFDSVAEVFGGACVAVLMTGMGHDGADGMKKLHDKGAFSIAQDEQTSVVFGMPAAAIRQGAASVVSPLDRIAHHMAKGLFVDY